MKRFGGHPYERGDMIDFKTIDPTKPFDETLRALGYNANELVKGGCGRMGEGR